MEELWSHLQPVVSNNIWLVVGAISLVFSIFRKLVKLAIVAGIVLALWLVATYFGVPSMIPM